MTITPAEVLMWTGIPVSFAQLEVFGEAAAAALDSDGGSAISGASRNQLLSYLIAGYMDAAAGNVGKQSESIGDYSYANRTTNGTSVWYDLYRETLSSLISSAGQVPGSTAVSGTPMVDRMDTDVIRLNRTYPRSAGRMI